VDWRTAAVAWIVVDRGQRTENREQRTENREQRTENREQRTENREQRTVVSGRWTVGGGVGGVSGVGFVLSRPSRKNKDPARVGHPFIVEGEGG
jgi:hypothetical protein